MTPTRLLEEAHGFLELGLYQDAEQTLREVTAEDPAAHDRARLDLAELCLEERRFEEAAAIGRELIAHGAIRYQTILTTTMALHFLGRIKEAREVLLLVDRCGRRIEDDAYQMACFASRLGEFDEALRWLMLEYRRSTEYWAKSLSDTDLIPFWKWLSGHTPTLEEAHLLVEAPLVEVHQAALKESDDPWLHADELARLGERSRRLFRYDHRTGCYVLNPLAVAADGEAATNDRNTRRSALGMLEMFLVLVRVKALDVVLKAQPRYASQHAAWGNQLGVRYHLTWALQHRPKILARFAAEPAVWPFAPLLREIEGVQAIDARFFERMSLVDRMKDRDLDGAWKIVDETPVELRGNAFYRLRLAGLYEADHDYARALPIWIELCHHWPADVVGFGNAAACLLKMGRTNDARRVLDNAPACYRSFALHRMQWSEVRRGERDADSRPREFKGHPDLGGLLIADPSSPADETAEAETTS